VVSESAATYTHPPGNANMFRWELVKLPFCNCDFKPQTAKRLITVPYNTLPTRISQHSEGTLNSPFQCLMSSRKAVNFSF